MPSIVLVGLAHWHVPLHVAAARAAGLAVVGGWDPDPAVVAERAASLGLPALPALSAALSAGAGLAVVTGTPPEMPDRLRAAAEVGLPVLVEKPVTGDADALAPLVKALAGRFVAVALPHRTGPLAEAAGGDVRHLAFRLVNGPPARYRAWGAGWVLDPAVGGGGALRNLGIHGIDLALHLCGPDLRVRSALLRRWHGEAVEDHAVVTLEGPDGRTATVEAGYLHPSDAGSDFAIRRIGATGIAIDDGTHLRTAGADGTWGVRPVVPLARRYETLMADVAARLGDGRPPAAGLPDLLAAMRRIDEAYAAGGDR